MEHILDLAAVDEKDQDRIGSKALNLGRMIRAGLPVPPGFCIDELVSPTDPRIAAAYSALGGGMVAVRSSAVGEDEATSAAAGVYLSRIGVHGEIALAEAIQAVHQSYRADHVSTYRPGNPPRIGVIVQRLVAAEVAGVIFTHDPSDESGRCLAIAAGWGLGSPIVGGAAADRFRVDRQSGRVIEQSVAQKLEQDTIAGIASVPPELSGIACLNANQIKCLASLAIAVEGIFGEPCDIEWAWAAEHFWLLQSRPITVGPDAGLDGLRERDIQFLAALADPRGTVWTRYQLAESVPRPTPMTWGILQDLLSVRGGYGRMLRALGFDPDPRVDDTGFVQLIAGQPYLNLNLEARLDYRDIPYSVDFDRLKRDPALALLPQRNLRASQLPLRFWWRLPMTLVRVWRQTRRLPRLQAAYAQNVTEHIFPAFAERVRQARRLTLADQSVESVLALLDEWRRRTLVEFAETALQPAIFASLALQEWLAGAEGKDREKRMHHLLGVLASAVRPVESDHPAAMSALIRGDLKLQAFLANFGHRGPEELELTQPRWREVPIVTEHLHLPRDGPIVRADLAKEPWAVRSYCTAVELRERARHYFMMGYSFLRELLLDLDRRFQLSGGIFFLRPQELPEVLAGAEVHRRIRIRRREYNLCRSLSVPAVIFSDDLQAIGRPVEHTESVSWKGHPISPGLGEGPAVVAATPASFNFPIAQGIVLICSHVDAAWLKVLVNAVAVVLETGSDLSHGAILLRELGIPAVAGIPGVVAAIATGDRIRVDGQRGEVTRISCVVGNDSG